MHAYRRAHSVREGAGEPFRLCMLCQFLCCGLHDCAIRPVDALICIKPPETGVVQMAGEAGEYLRCSS